MSYTKIEIDHFCGTNAIKNGVYFHPNGNSFVSSSGCNVVISDVIDPHVQITLAKHDDMITSLALSSRGNYIASGQRGDNADVVVWSFDKQSVVYVFEEHDYMIEDLSFSLDEKILVTLGNSEDGKLIFWDLSNGAIISSCSKLPTGTKCVKNGGFVKDVKRKNTGDYLVATGGQEGLMLWYLDPYQGHLESIKIAAEIKRAITSISFTDDGEILFASTSSGDLIVFSIRSLKVLSLLTLSTRTGLSSVLSCPTNNLVIAGSMERKVRLYDVNSQSVLGEILLDGSIISLSPSQDRIEVLALTSNGTIARCNISTFQNIIITESHSNSITSISFCRQRNDRFASSSLDGTIRVWDLIEYTVLSTSAPIRNQARGTYPTCISFDTMIISGWTDGKIIAYDPLDGKYLWHIDNAHVDGVTAIVLSHNGRFILSGGVNGEVRLWDIRSRELITHLKEHTNKVTALQLFDDDAIAVSCSKDRSILKWDLRSERRVHCHTQRMGGINGIALSKDEQYVMSVGQEKKLTYWENRTADAVHSLLIHDGQDEGRCIARSYNGKLIATGGTMGIVRLWDYDSARLLSETKGHSLPISSISFSNDDKLLVSGGEDGAVYIWNIFDV